METIASIPLIGGFISTVLPFIVVLAIVVFVHEFGHYIVARWCGIRSEVFSIGFGPVLWSRRDRRGTLWQVAALPLGGYVRFLGDSDGSSRADAEALDQLSPAERRASFHGASVGRRMLTVLAGPVFNFLLTILIFSGIATWQGVPTERPVVGEIAALPGVDHGLRPGDVLLAADGHPIAGLEEFYAAAQAMPTPEPIQLVVERSGEMLELEVPFPLPPLVQAVEPFLPASEAGLRKGDLVLSVDGRGLASFTQLQEAVLASDGQSLTMEVWRDGEVRTVTVTPIEKDYPSADGGFQKKLMIGAMSAPLFEAKTETPDPLKAAWIGVVRTYLVVDQSIEGLFAVLSGEISADNLQGPVGIAQISGEVAAQGFLQFLGWAAILSTAIGFMNLLPIPNLDGGHFVAFLIEAVRGRPPSPAAMQIAMSIGLGLVLLLMVFATYNDIMRMVS